MGPYRLLLAPVDSTAESRPAAVAVGDTVRGEAIAPLGDVDTFTLAGTAGDTITIMLAGEVAEARVPLRGTLLDSLGREVQTTLGSTGTPGRAGPETGRLQLPYTGTYRVRVHGETSGRDGSEAMPYRLVVERVSMRPEGGPAILALGVTRRERLDLRGDLDEFELRAPPHAEVKVQFDDLTGISTGSLRAMVRMLDGQTGAELSVHYTAPWIGQRTAMFMRMPPSGHIRVRVFEMGALGCMEACRLFGLTGDFDILATQMDQAVEGHSGTLAIGEMATGNLATADDIDSYTFEATAGTQLWFRFRHVSGPGVMVAMLRDAETGADVSGFLSRTPMATASQWPVNITRTGRYTVWVGPEVPGGFIAPIGGSGAERGNYEVGVLRR